MRCFPFLTVILWSCLSSCNNQPDHFLITKSSIGMLTDSTEVRALQSVFVNDSISSSIGGDEFIGNTNTIYVYDKMTKNVLLELSPSQSLDSLSTIRTVRIMDERYQNKLGLNKNTTFKTIKSAYTISNIQNTLRHLIVSVNDINAYFTLNKNELPEEMRYDMDLKFEVIQIPDDAKISDFYIQWY